MNHTCVKTNAQALLSSKLARVGLGVALSAVCLYAAVRNVAFADLQHALYGADVRFVGLALLSVIANTAAKTVRWKVLMARSSHQASFWQALRALLIGQMLNLIVPVRVGDASRAFTLGDSGAGRLFTLGTVALEKYLDLLSYALLFVVLLLLLPLPGWIIYTAYTVSTVAVVVSSGVMVLTRYRTLFPRLVERGAIWLPTRMRTKVVQGAGAGLLSLQVLQSRSAVLKLAGWSAIVWATALLNNHLVLIALNLHLPIAASLLLLIALQAGISLPSVAGAIGVFEYLCVLSLAVFGVEQGVAFSYGILLHMVVMFPPVLAGLLLAPGSVFSTKKPDSSGSSV